MNYIDEPKEMKKLAAKIRKELCTIKRNEIAAMIRKSAETNNWTADNIERLGIDKMVGEYGTYKIQCTKSHGVQTLRIVRNSFFDEETVKQVIAKYPIHQVADVVSSGCANFGETQMAFQYNRA